MSIFKREWTAHEAEEWTKEDWFAIILSPFSYILIGFGAALSIFLLPLGFILLAIGIFITVLMFWVIDPKLKAVSSSYEAKQREYLKDLEKIQRWEED